MIGKTWKITVTMKYDLTLHKLYEMQTSVYAISEKKLLAK